MKLHAGEEEVDDKNKSILFRILFNLIWNLKFFLLFEYTLYNFKTSTFLEGGKAAKKDDKKTAKKGGKGEEEAPKEISPSEKDLKNGISIEK